MNDFRGVAGPAPFVDRPIATQILDRLETEGLVRRVDDPVDGRVVRAQLTARCETHHQL